MHRLGEVEAVGAGRLSATLAGGDEAAAGKGVDRAFDVGACKFRRFCDFATAGPCPVAGRVLDRREVEADAELRLCETWGECG